MQFVSAHRAAMPSCCSFDRHVERAIERVEALFDPVAPIRVDEATGMRIHDEVAALMLRQFGLAPCYTAPGVLAESDQIAPATVARADRFFRMMQGAP